MKLIYRTNQNNTKTVEVVETSENRYRSVNSVKTHWGRTHTYYEYEPMFDRLNAHRGFSKPRKVGDEVTVI